MSANVSHLRQPPHSIEAEQSLLGGVMLDPRCWARVSNLVASADFFRRDHLLVWDAVDALAAEGQSADPVSVIAWLARANQLEAAGGRDYIAQLVAETPSAANVDSYARIVRERAALRRLAIVGAELQRLAFEQTDRTVHETYAEASA